MMNTREQVIDIIVNKLGVERETVVDSASFTNDLGADSLDTVELIMEFEREFEINIPDNQAEKISTVGEAISFVEEAVNNK
ncbi:MAG: acyl carrier protein [Lentimicrobiaceae bacterium]|nr:acyl carrier protein [Lentimicrobiaceae bacterium]MBQ4548931.1 acyl carrier protein [Bacteroidales bacterium]MBR2051593.1 acyl carrier protein [Bacteroidales bacterium]